MAQARSDGRDGVKCIVLGRGADEPQVIEWVKIGAAVDGFDGFAVGRTLWEDALKDFLAGKASRTRLSTEISAATGTSSTRTAAPSAATSSATAGATR